MPPIAEVALPWDRPGMDVVAELGEARRRLGDQFVVDSGDDRYLFVLSPKGVAAFYSLDEAVASKGVADWRMLRRKLPPEVFAGRRTVPHELFARTDVEHYLRQLSWALELAIGELGDSGATEIFGFTRRLAHRMGLASWGGPGMAEGATFERLVDALETLDAAQSFVNPEAMATVAATDYREERAALAAVTEETAVALDRAARTPADQSPLFRRIAARWADERPPAASLGVALDIALVHVASMSNLVAALGWAIVDVVDHPQLAARVAAGDRRLAECCALESTRLAQRSIMARFVLAPLVLDVGDEPLAIEPGVTIATLLPLTNTSAAPGLADWQPERWEQRRLCRPELAVPELVTTFGHGRHRCPARSFSLAAMATTLVRLFERYDMTGQWHGRPPYQPAQIGGVGRPSLPCVVDYRLRRPGAPTGAGRQAPGSGQHASVTGAATSTTSTAEATGTSGGPPAARRRSS
jgi:cytochrome P450